MREYKLMSDEDLDKKLEKALKRWRSKLVNTYGEIEVRCAELLMNEIRAEQELREEHAHDVY